MGWKSSWNKQSPVEKRRRELEEQAESLSQQKAALEAELLRRDIIGGQLESEPIPTVWNERNEASFTKEEEWISRPGRPPVLSVQRHRDRNVFLALAAVLLVIVILLVRAAMH
jgi:hypothetical protein